jgi:inosine-uridine nucleoside N-ribohydrolase
MLQKIIIDTDPGIDDAMAIHMAFADTRLEVVGLTSIFGNVTTAIATRNARRLAEMAHYKTLIAEGATVPLVRAPEPPADFVHGAEGFGNVPASTPTGTPDARSAAQFLVDCCAAAPGEIVICAVGPLTNLAAALSLDPSIARTVKSVVIMGGSAAFHGNVTACAEANIWNDPEAADLVFGADWDVTMVGLDVTEKTQCTPADFTMLAEKSPKIGGFLRNAAEFYFDFHQQKTGVRSCFMHDPSAILAITDPQVFTYEMMPLRVVCDGLEIGRTKRYDGTDRRPVKVAMGVDDTMAREKFLALIAAADSISQSRRDG